MANRTGYSLPHHVCRLLSLVLLLLAFGASPSALAQPSEDVMRLRSITPPMVDPASMGTRWAIWRDADGSDSERAFDAFLQIALPAWLVLSGCRRIHRRWPGHAPQTSAATASGLCTRSCPRHGTRLS